MHPRPVAGPRRSVGRVGTRMESNQIWPRSIRFDLQPPPSRVKSQRSLAALGGAGNRDARLRHRSLLLLEGSGPALLPALQGSATLNASLSSSPPARPKPNASRISSRLQPPVLGLNNGNPPAWPVLVGGTGGWVEDRAVQAVVGGGGGVSVVSCGEWWVLAWAVGGVSSLEGQAAAAASAWRQESVSSSTDTNTSQQHPHSGPRPDSCHFCRPARVVLPKQGPCVAQPPHCAA